MVQIPERLEFGNPDHIRAVREYEEKQARREAGFRRWVVGYEITAGGEVEVEARSEEEARLLVETGKVPVEADFSEFDAVDVVYVRAAEGERATPELPAARQLRLFEQPEVAW